MPYLTFPDASSCVLEGDMSGMQGDRCKQDHAGDLRGAWFTPAVPSEEHY